MAKPTIADAVERVRQDPDARFAAVLAAVFAFSLGFALGFALAQTDTGVAEPDSEAGRPGGAGPVG